MDVQRHRLGRNVRTGWRRLEVTPPTLPPPYKITSPDVPSVRQHRDAPLCRKGSSGDPGRVLEGTIHSSSIIMCTPEAASHHAQVERQVQEFLTAPVPPLPGVYFVSPAETGRATARLPKRKAPGPDGIPTAVIRQLPRRAMVAMTRLFNGILRTGHFPRNWKMGRVIAIPKPGKNT
ncbi:RNA-directed DNA polymerase from mobile element jockey [Eumeta japonica]|uniref:RNA-directed DNA polymerase from mobile element jockey n=1 Tax=Eumeta variegata TaxID=151549 RepID=A0A4C1T4H6_EUMVA|nr:RNA-directed DNA polymerase from mobile element jockey [Eumeta japonica]